MKVKFLKDYTVRDAEAKTYRTGAVVEMPLASAQHFLNRGAAVEVTEEPKPIAKPKGKLAAVVAKVAPTR